MQLRKILHGILRLSPWGAFAVGMGAAAAANAAPGTVLVQIVGDKLQITEPGRSGAPLALDIAQASELGTLVRKLGGVAAPVAIPVNHLVVADGGVNSSGSRSKKTQEEEAQKNKGT